MNQPGNAEVPASGSSITCRSSPEAHISTTTQHAAGNWAEAAAAWRSERAALFASGLTGRLTPAQLLKCLCNRKDSVLKLHLKWGLEGQRFSVDF